jgi:hypothetical protein
MQLTSEAEKHWKALTKSTIRNLEGPGCITKIEDSWQENTVCYVSLSDQMYHNLQIPHARVGRRILANDPFGWCHVIYSMPVRNSGFEAGFAGWCWTNISGSFRGPDILYNFNQFVSHVSQAHLMKRNLVSVAGHLGT